MDKVDIKHLELLLGKLSQEIGNTQFCIYPNFYHDGCHISTFSENGKVDLQITGYNLEDVLSKFNLVNVTHSRAL